MKAPRPGRGRMRCRGVALVMVLWVVLLLASMAAALLSTQRTEVGLTRNALLAAEGRALVEAGVGYAVYRLRSTGTEAWLPDGEPRAWRYDGHEVRIRMRPEISLVDLNAATPLWLGALFQALGAPPEQAEALAGAVADWRDPDDLARMHGAEERAYRAAGRPYGPANAAFADVAELRLVLGMEPELYARVRPLVTVDARQAEPMTVAAPEPVRAAAAIAGGAGLPAEPPDVEQLLGGFGRAAASGGVAFGGGASEADAARNALRIEVTVVLGPEAVFRGEVTVTADVSADQGFLVTKWHNLGFAGAEGA